MRKHFRPELLNRLDEIVVFDTLSREQLVKVARLQMKDVANRLAARGIALAVTDAALDYIVGESYDPAGSLFTYLLSYDALKNCSELYLMPFCGYLQVYGARPIRRWLEKKLVTELSRMLLREDIDENSRVCIGVGFKGRELVYRVEKNGEVVDLATGQKSDILNQIPDGPVLQINEEIKE